MVLDRTKVPEIRDFEHLDIPRCRKLRLDNGINLNVLDHGEFDVNRLTMSWVGGANDVDSFTTLMLASDLMREGTDFHSGAEIAEILDYNGAWLRSNFHSHHTALILYSLNSKFNDVLPIITESILSPNFPCQEFEINKEKMARRKEINLSKVAYLSNRSNHKLIYGEDHPCSTDESPDDIREISCDDVKNIHRKVFTPNGCELFLAGRISPKIEDMINDQFGRLMLSDDTISHRIIPIQPSSQKEDIITVSESLQSAITMSIPTIPRSNPDYNDLRYTVMALGGYFGSRLMTNIREDKGYTYGISSALLGNWEGGVMTISTQCDNNYSMAVVDEIKKEVVNLKKNDFCNDELNRLKRFAMTQIAGMLDSPFSIMDYYENQRHVLTPVDYYKQMQQSINSLTSLRISELADKYLNVDEFRISIAGNPNNKV